MTSLDNYSKWDHIQLSEDDDEDCHPNIEKYTWRRLRKQQREQQREKDDHEAERMLAQISALEQKIEALKKHGSSAMVQANISRHQKEIDQMKKYLDKKEKAKKLTPEELCHDSFDSTIVNKNADLEHTTPPALQKKLQEPEQIDAKKFGQWQEANGDILEEYVACSSLDKSRTMVQDNPQLLTPYATGWILLKALELEMMGKSDEMRNAVRQNQLLQYPLDLAKLTPGLTPQQAAASFFSKIDRPQQRQIFEADVEDFAIKIKQRAVQKRKEQMGQAGKAGPDLPVVREGDTEYQVLSKAERMGPGGLDPLEVLEELPPAMKQAFMDHDMPALHKAVKDMTVEEAHHWMDKCRKSGLWVDSGEAEDGAEADEEPEDAAFGTTVKTVE